MDLALPVSVLDLYPSLGRVRVIHWSPSRSLYKRRQHRSHPSRFGKRLPWPDWKDRRIEHWGLEWVSSAVWEFAICSLRMAPVPSAAISASVSSSVATLPIVISSCLLSRPKICAGLAYGDALTNVQHSKMANGAARAKDPAGKSI